MFTKGSFILFVPFTGAIYKDFKVKVPDTFLEKRSKLKYFLLQVDLYIGFYITRFVSDTKKVAWTATLLRGLALN